LGLLGIPCPLLAPIAGFMGEADLKAMKEGRMDKLGEANTRAGMTIGFVTTLVYGALILTALSHRY
jgi:hypothetical protein